MLTWPIHSQQQIYQGSKALSSPRGRLSTADSAGRRSWSCGRAQRFPGVKTGGALERRNLDSGFRQSRSPASPSCRPPSPSEGRPGRQSSFRWSRARAPPAVRSSSPGVPLRGSHEQSRWGGRDCFPAWWQPPLRRGQPSPPARHPRSLRSLLNHPLADKAEK